MGKPQDAITGADARGPVPTSEQRLIAEIFAPLSEGDASALGLLDDAALLRVPDGQELVVTKDALVAGTHFFADDPPADVGHKALAVNLSDLAAKGAEPRCYMLAIALRSPCDAAWLREFSGGLRRLQDAHGCTLIGGDTVATSGPITISITAFGLVPLGGMIKRGGASPGDHVYVSGTIGDAALGLMARRDPDDFKSRGLDEAAAGSLVSRYLRPQPRVALVPILRKYATASIDVSDGLLGDFEKLCAVSGVSGTIEERRIPLSGPARQLLDQDPGLLETLVCGGDDYEILLTVGPDAQDQFEEDVSALDLPVSRIGRISAAGGQTGIAGADGVIRPFKRSSYDHFG
jgi:thiamine-monophosphate kinase